MPSRKNPWVLLPVLAVFAVAPVASAQETAEEPTVLIEVNGEPITSQQLDSMIMLSHGAMDMTQTDEQLMVRLLEKAVNDALIVQEAVAMELHEDPVLVSKVEEEATKVAVAEYLKDAFVPPTEVSEEEILTFFDDMYHRIQLRQISLRTRAEAEETRAMVLAGADMDALAREVSLDSKKPRGGLHNFIHWADLEVPLREQSVDLAVGEMSEVFPYREAFAFVRCEQRSEPDRAELETYRNFIKGVLVSQEQDAAWDEFVDGLEAQTPVEVRQDVLDRMRADAHLVFRGEFRVQSETPVLVIDDEQFMTEGEFRERTGTLAMEMGDQDFETILEASLEREVERLLARAHAARGGYFEHPEVVAAYDATMEEELISHYLNETVVSKIWFDREEFVAFYEEHQDDFRGDEEVKISFLLLESLEAAENAVERLAQGADFEYLRKELKQDAHSGGDAGKWAPLRMFAPDIVEAVGTMQVGDTSQALPFNSRYMVLRLDGRREGEVLPMEAVDMDIRQALFQRKFAELLDEQLKLLKERSDIVRHEDRIRKYFSAES